MNEKVMGIIKKFSPFLITLIVVIILAILPLIKSIETAKILIVLIIIVVMIFSFIAVYKYLINHFNNNDYKNDDAIQNTKDKFSKVCNTIYKIVDYISEKLADFISSRK